MSSPSALEILGHWVDAVACTVTLSESKKATFAAEVDVFLSTLAPPLIDWWRLSGYAQWACYSNPFAKFALKSLYNKTKGIKRRNAPVHVSKEVKANLRWFAAEILAAPALNFLDPALNRWARVQADAVYYTDSYLSSADGSVGLGFWTREPLHPGAEAQRFLDFYHRDPFPMLNIQVAEGLAISGALDYTLHAHPCPCRVMIITDSGPNVYAIDASRGSAKVLNLVWFAYLELNDAGIDPRIHHLAEV